MYANEIHTLFDNVPLPKSSIKLMTSNSVKHKAMWKVQIIVFVGRSQGPRCVHFCT